MAAVSTRTLLKGPSAGARLDGVPGLGRARRSGAGRLHWGELVAGVLLLVALAAGSALGQERFSAVETISTTVGNFDTGDVNGDGALDVLSCSFSENRCVWYENLFENFRELPIGGVSGASAIVSGDVDGDGDIDAVVSKPRPGSIFWIENVDGNGTFLEHIVNRSTETVASLAVHDFDGDGDVDILRIGYGTTSWYRNAGGGVFVEAQVIAIESPRIPSNGVLAAAVFDVDGDGDVDILSGNSATGSLAWYPNTDGLGQFGPRQPIDQFPGRTNTVPSLAEIGGVAAGDLDGDGDFEALVTTGSGFLWYENLGSNELFGPRQSVALPNPGTFPFREPVVAGLFSPRVKACTRGLGDPRARALLRCGVCHKTTRSRHSTQTKSRTNV